MKLIIGLGNPGEKYANDRHNVGFMVLDALAKEGGANSVWSTKFKSLVLKHRDILLIKPQTYMNNSGQAVRAVVDYYKTDISNLLVIYDDLDLPFGTIRFRQRGSSGGHNGIKSITTLLGTVEFPRLKIGIGRPPAGLNPADYVLSPFSAEEKITLEKEVIPKVLEKTEYI